ncbi:TRAP transporter substrate-binding protein DctP [Marinobacter sp.]|uniref:TRAP transporter substrate-binding protein DctP n=1 Tax=Marinobacter sp. TaxID=50741 RepID=UPI0035687C8D
MKAVSNRSLTLILASSLLLGACSDNDDALTGLFPEEEEPETWRFALEEVGGSVQDAWAQEFRRRMQALSDGEVQVEIYPYGSIGNSPHLTRLAQDGRVHLAFASPGHVADDIPEAGVFLLPYLFPESDQATRNMLADPELATLLEEAWADAGLHLLSLVPEGWMTWTANRPLLHPEDFSGLRMRTMTAPIHQAVVEAWGAEAIALPYGDVHEALQLGQVDGQSNPAFAVTEMQFQEFQSHITLPGATRFVASLVSNREWYQNLDSKHRQWLDEAHKGMPEFIDDVQQEYNQRSLQQLRENGQIVVHELSQDQKAAFHAAAGPANDAYRAQAGERGERILERIELLSDAAREADR